MEKQNLAKLLSLLVFFVFLTFSCSKDNELEKTEILFDKYFVELSAINEIASGIHFPIEGSSSLKSTVQHTTKSISGIAEIKNSNGKTSFYIINYDEGGFVLLSADKRIPPILGFSFNNNFEVEENTYPPGLKFWMDDAKEQIKAIQLSNIKQTQKEEIAWDQVQQSLIDEISSLKYEPPPDCYEHTEVITVGPITTPLWHQGYSYNAELPEIMCSGYSVHPLVGCLPLAMAMVMRTHEYPTNYSWSSMPFGYATSTTANFIEDLHDAIHNEDDDYPDYTCEEGTFVSTAVVDDVFEDHFNYTNSSTAVYNYNTVITNIDYDRPVILVGSGGGECHAWVCTGFRYYNYYDDDCGMVSHLHFYMNWGWNGDYNGWFAYDNWNPGDDTFNDDKLMIYNIIP
jgi:Spi protease inhibitor/Peptidase C10 family